MTDKEKEAIEYWKRELNHYEYTKDLDLASDNYFGQFEEKINMISGILNLIEKQQAEIKDYGEEYNHWAHKAVTRAIELEKKDKRISDLEFALMDMVLQFADENKDRINTMGLSALETAFNELNFDNPMSIKEVHKRYKELAQKYYQ